MKLSINLQEIGELDRSILRTLKKNLKWSLKSFNLSIEILDNVIPLTKAEYNPLKKQFDANLIMQNLYNAYKKEGGFRTLGISNSDIYVNRYNFIFGSARNPDKIFTPYSPVALISVHRLREEFYGMKEDQALFELRVLKEALHELGHTLGLLHCENDCVMIFSNTVEDTDNKPPKFCTHCKTNLELFFQNTF
ncbi:MAG: archaemetzincin family Zn-dependent metalloprotease [Candidatus Thorarchaeota archaeon]